MAIPALNAAGPSSPTHPLEPLPKVPARRVAILRNKASWARAGRSLWAWPFPLAVLALWQLYAVWGWVPEQVLPPPAAMFKVFGELLASGELWD